MASAVQRAATAILERLGTRRWGYPPRLMAPVVAEIGPFKALLWFAWNMRRYGRTLKSYGAVRTHLICIAISAINDCEYCTFAYSMALELAYLQEHNRLFPVAELALDELRQLCPAAIRSALIAIVQRAGLHADVRSIDRAITLALAPDQRATDPEDETIAHLVRMFGTLNSIAIASGIAPDEAPTPLNKDRTLKRRYATLRARTAT